MFVKKSLFLLCTVFMFCESAFVDTLSKCDINDNACTKDLIQSVLKRISKTGVKELEIPPFDPMELKNISIAVLDILDITMIEGTLKGPKDCIITRFEADVENERAFLDLTCDLSIKGRYKVYSNSPLVKSFTGGNTLRGEGNGKVKIEKLYLKLDFRFYIQKRNDEIYIKCKPDKFKYSFDIKGKMLFFADQIYIGKQESSKLVTGLLNENWRSMISTFGKPFMDKACKEFILVFLHNFFGNVPVRYYITTDLSKYAREEEE